ncbi:MAG: phosphoglucosamine mutase [Bacteroidales bacterium]|nr:phosphoglucosamine mutase [Bacteroidales bacterium]
MIAIHPELIVSVSGVRGIVGHSLTPDDAVRFGQAYGNFVGSGKTILLSRDGRPSGWMLGHAVTAGLLAAGCRVRDMGIAPTPTVGVAVRAFQADGAVQITASHNPAPWNGLKLFGPDGAVLPPEPGRAVKERFLAGEFQRVGWDKLAPSTSVTGVESVHADLAADLANREAVRRANFRVLLDGNGGSGGPTGLQLLDRLGCGVVPLHVEPTGHFSHEAEPIPAHLGGVAEAVRQAGVAVGCVLDPDSDRLALIDERGECISEEATVALAVRYRLRRDPGPIVINMSTSRMSEDLARQAGVACHRSAVGEANVVAKMRETDAVLGGEGSGGVVDPRVGWVRDPFVGMALILSLMVEEQKPLSTLVAELPQYAMQKEKIRIEPSQLARALGSLSTRWPDVQANQRDGLRLDGPDWWLHVRPSNTEPVVRVIAEARTAEQAAALCREAEAIVKGG